MYYKLGFLICQNHKDNRRDNFIEYIIIYIFVLLFEGHKDFIFKTLLTRCCHLFLYVLGVKMSGFLCCY